MSDEGELVVDGVRVRFEPSSDGRVRVIAGDDVVGSIERASATGFTAFDRNGESLTRPSPWGGRVTARFGSRELAVRALVVADAP